MEGLLELVDEHGLPDEISLHRSQRLLVLLHLLVHLVHGFRKGVLLQLALFS